MNTTSHRIITYVESNIEIVDELRQTLNKRDDDQIKIKCYKGQRAKLKLPRRGQRTHTNAKVSKKPVINILIKSTPNNTIIHAMLADNKSILVRPGILGFKGAKRSTKHAAQQAAEFMTAKLTENKIKYVTLLLKGFGKGRKSILKGLRKKRLNILKYIDQTPKIHNGCRQKKKRRL